MNKLTKEKNHKCVHCGESKQTDLEFEDGRFICDDCAMIVGELADIQD